VFPVLSFVSLSVVRWWLTLVVGYDMDCGERDGDDDVIVSVSALCAVGDCIVSLFRPASIYLFIPLPCFFWPLLIPGFLPLVER
jgi:hypothetical protein